LVALPLKSQSAIALGRIEEDYNYKELAPTIRHTRPVKWLKTIPRSQFDQDLLFSLGALMTVCQIKRYDAENRITKMQFKVCMLGARVK
jgi:restriction system protein